MSAAEDHVGAGSASAGRPATPFALNHLLGAAARTRAPQVEVADLDVIVDTAAALSATDEDTDPVAVAEALGAATDAADRQARVRFPHSRPASCCPRRRAGRTSPRCSIA